MNILFISSKGELLPLAKRVKEEGYVERLSILDTRYIYRGEGVVDKGIGGGLVGNVQREAERFEADLVICDWGGKNSKLISPGKVASNLKDRGFKVWGASKWSDLLSNSDDYASYFTPNGNGLGGWWDGTRFSIVYKVIFYRGFMGPKVGINLVSACEVRSTQEKMPEELTKLLRKVEYTGPVRLGGENKLSIGFELCVFAALEAITKVGVGEMLEGKLVLEEGHIGVSVLVSLPPFPYNIGTYDSVKFEVEEGADKYFWGVDVTRGGSAGLDGMLGWVSARGRDLRECKKRVYRTIDNMRGIEGLQFRSDLFS